MGYHNGRYQEGREQVKRNLYGGLGVIMMGLTAVVLAGCGSEADRIKGTWRGTLDLGKAMPAAAPKGAALRLVWHIDKQSDGTLGGTLDSPDQGATGISLDTVTVKDGTFHL